MSSRRMATRAQPSPSGFKALPDTKRTRKPKNIKDELASASTKSAATKSATAKRASYKAKTRAIAKSKKTPATDINDEDSSAAEYREASGTGVENVQDSSIAKSKEASSNEIQTVQNSSAAKSKEASSAEVQIFQDHTTAATPRKSIFYRPGPPQRSEKELRARALAAVAARKAAELDELDEPSESTSPRLHRQPSLKQGLEDNTLKLPETRKRMENHSHQLVIPATNLGPRIVLTDHYIIESVRGLVRFALDNPNKQIPSAMQMETLVASWEAQQGSTAQAQAPSPTIPESVEETAVSEEETSGSEEETSRSEEVTAVSRDTTMASEEDAREVHEANKLQITQTPRQTTWASGWLGSVISPFKSLLGRGEQATSTTSTPAAAPHANQRTEIQQAVEETFDVTMSGGLVDIPVPSQIPIPTSANETPVKINTRATPTISTPSYSVSSNKEYIPVERRGVMTPQRAQAFERKKQSGLIKSRTLKTPTFTSTPTSTSASTSASTLASTSTSTSTLTSTQEQDKEKKRAEDRAKHQATVEEVEDYEGGRQTGEKRKRTVPEGTYSCNFSDSSDSDSDSDTETAIEDVGRALKPRTPNAIPNTPKTPSRLRNVSILQLSPIVEEKENETPTETHLKPTKSIWENDSVREAPGYFGIGTDFPKYVGQGSHGRDLSSVGGACPASPFARAAASLF